MKAAAIVLCVLGFMCMPSAGRSRTWYIKSDGTGDAPTIRAGIDSAAAADTVLVAPGTYTGADNKNLDFGGANLVLKSESGPEVTTIDCQGSGRGLYLHSGEGLSSVVQGLTIENGHASHGGGILCQEASPTILGCIFAGNSADGEGGGIMVLWASSSPTIAGCTFTGNSAYDGGGVSCDQCGATTLTDCIFSGNSASQAAGGVYSILCSVTLTNCTFSGNWAEHYAGGFLAEFDVIAAITGCTFSGNWAVLDGGGVYFFDASGTVTDCTLSGNSAPGTGGILCEDSASCDVENTIVVFSTDGKGVWCDGTSTATLTCCDVYGNADGDWIGYVADQYGVDGNISEDPVFCNGPSGDFRLSSNSPCLGGPCSTIGAWGLGCIGELPFIMSVADVGNDQGRQVRIQWVRSLYDAPGDTVDITGYGIYRRQDLYMAQSFDRAGRESERHGADRATCAANWDYLATVPARGDSLYQFVAPTLCDSTAEQGMCWSVFFVSAMTPDPLAYYDSEPAGGYSIDNLAPCIPQGLACSCVGIAELWLHWNPNTEADLCHYAVYKGDGPDFVPNDATRIGAVTDTSFVDDDFGAGGQYYKVSAIDLNGNESGYVLLSPEEIVGAPGGDGKYRNMLFQNVPNPFERSTKIAFTLQKESAVQLRVYDAQGRLVRTMVNGVRRPDRYVEVWDGTNGAGRRMSSGMYFYELKVDGYDAVRKMVFIR